MQITLVCLLAGGLAHAQTVTQITWLSRNTASPVVLAKPADQLLPAFRTGLKTLPEAAIVSLSLAQPVFLGLTPEQGSELQKLLPERYRIIQDDPVFSKAPSALPYCYAAQKPTNGLATIFSPANVDTNTPCIVFLHGYGGSFLWAHQLLAEAFPKHIIICPAFGVSAANIPAGYINECLAAAEKSLAIKLRRPVLIGLSAGGFGASRVYIQNPARFEQLIVIAAYPPPETLNRFDRKSVARFVAGTREDYVQSGAFERSMNAIHTRAEHCEFKIVPEANHFFILSRCDETLKLLHSWIDP